MDFGLTVPNQNQQIKNYALEMLCVECTVKKQYHCFFYEEPKIFRLYEF